MTKKDFQAVAKALGIALSRHDLKDTQIIAIIERFTAEIAHTNPNFKAKVFHDFACDNVFVHRGD
jgi:hypothetical protein